MTFDLPGLFVAGLLTFVSPCVLPLVPIYLAVLGGASIADLRRGGRGGRLLGSAVAFSLGLTLVFVALGMAATAAGHALVAHRARLLQVGGFAVLIAGLKFLGLIQIPWLEVERRPLLSRVGQGGGFLGAFLLGGAFALGWTPCIGPVLGAVLTYTAGATSSMARGALYLALYSAGLVVPLILVAVAAPVGLRLLDRARAGLGWFAKVTGALMVVTGLLLVTDQLGRLGELGTPPPASASPPAKVEPAVPLPTEPAAAAPPSGEGAGATACEATTAAPAVAPVELPRGTALMVEFMSPSCAICRRMIPVVAAAGRTCSGVGVTAHNVDVSDPGGAALAARHGIRGIPTFLFLDREGHEVARLVGEQPLQILDQSLAVLSGRRCEGFREIRGRPGGVRPPG